MPFHRWHVAVITTGCFFGCVGAQDAASGRGHSRATTPDPVIVGELRPIPAPRPPTPAEAAPAAPTPEPQADPPADLRLADLFRKSAPATFGGLQVTGTGRPGGTSSGFLGIFALGVPYTSLGHAGSYAIVPHVPWHVRHRFRMPPSPLREAARECLWLLEPCWPGAELGNYRHVVFEYRLGPKHDIRQVRTDWRSGPTAPATCFDDGLERCVRGAVDRDELLTWAERRCGGPCGQPILERFGLRRPYPNPLPPSPYAGRAAAPPAPVRVTKASHVRLRTGQARISGGGLHEAVLKRVLAGYVDDIRACHAEVLDRAPDATGRLELRLTISRTGWVRAVHIERDSLGVPAVADCLRRDARLWSFPANRRGNIELSVPVELTAVDDLVW